MNLKPILFAILTLIPAGLGYQALKKPSNPALVSYIAETYKKPFHDVVEVLEAVKHASEAHGVKEELIMAVIATESSFDMNATSKSGALGLMQIHSSSGKEYGDSIKEHVNNGVELLANYINRFGTKAGIMAYNMGAANVAKGKTNEKFYQQVKKRVILFGTRG